MREPSKTIARSLLRLLLTAIVLALFSTPASAQLVSIFVGNLETSSPSGGTGGTGFGRATLDDSIDPMFISVKFSLTYSGLSSEVTRIQAVCNPAAGQPPITPFELMNPGGTSGFVRNQNFLFIDPAAAQAMREGRCHFVVKTMNHPLGEIQGQILHDNPHVGSLNGAQHTPPNTSAGLGYTRISLNASETQIMVSLQYGYILGGQSAVLNGLPGQPVKDLGAPDEGGPAFFFGAYYDKLFNVTPQEVALLKSGGFSAYVTTNVANNNIRGRVLPLGRGPRVSDFDADGLTDIAVWRPGAVVSTWYVVQSANGGFTYNNWGLTGDILTPADYDNDGQTDRAVARDEDGFLVWYLEPSSTFDPNNPGNNLVTFPFGLATDRTVPRDYDGDGQADVAVFRPSDATFYILQSTTKTIRYHQFGQVGDVAYPGDYDGDRKADVAVYRPSTNVFYVWRSSDQTLQTETFQFTADRIAPADYDGDGKWDITYIESFGDGSSRWYIRQSSNGVLVAIVFGEKSRIPVPADYDGDAKADLAGWHPDILTGLGTWYIRRSTDGVVLTMQFGIHRDHPVPATLAPGGSL